MTGIFCRLCFQDIINPSIIYAKDYKKEKKIKNPNQRNMGNAEIKKESRSMVLNNDEAWLNRNSIYTNL